MMDDEKILDDELLEKTAGGESGWGVDGAPLYRCQNCWCVYGSGYTPSPCPDCGSTDVVPYP